MTTPGGPLDTRAPMPFPTRPPGRDSTRTIAVVALCVGAGALLLQLASFVIPFALFAGFGLLGAGVEDDGGWMGPEGDWSAETYGSASGGGVTPGPGGSVSGSALAAAVHDLGLSEGMGPVLGDDLRCDDVTRAARDVSVLCRAQDPTSFAVVVFDDASGSFHVHYLSTGD